ncbi:MAG: glycosyltransferase family 2 protein [Jatrophihabitans sp.]
MTVPVTATADVRYSVVVPVYGNRDTLPALVSRFTSIQERLDGEFEAVFVIDGSPDDSYAVLRDLLDTGPLRAQLITHSRNFGSYAAIRTGLGSARGDYIAIMAADLQEPPELTLDFFAWLSSGEYDVGVGARVGRDDPARNSIMSRTFWRGYRRFVMPDIPNGGVDIFACTRQVAAQLTAMHESHTSMVAQLFWLGYRRVEVPYQRLARPSGRSGWSMRRRVKYMLDSIFAFTNLPITVLVLIGALGLLGSAVAATTVFVIWATGGISVPGYTALMLVTLLIGSSLLTGLGVVGSYVWRTYENSKGRPFAVSRSHELFAAPDSAWLRGDGHGPLE